jgi:hypothetical protein
VIGLFISQHMVAPLNPAGLLPRYAATQAGKNWIILDARRSQEPVGYKDSLQVQGHSARPRNHVCTRYTLRLVGIRLKLNQSRSYIQTRPGDQWVAWFLAPSFSRHSRVLQSQFNYAKFNVKSCFDHPLCHSIGTTLYILKCYVIILAQYL